ncbi:MAG: N-acetylmuramoyl-L-alanine amidase [Chloroflexi bacterium]|nr:N-acetylmuramoyl-L-alanine amidase [Chloroflexota bacterium]
MPTHRSRRTFLRQTGALLALAWAARAPARLAFARESPPLIAIDPGHGGRYIGAVLRGPGGVALLEKEVNLDVALRLAELLEQAGLQAVLTRDHDAEVAAVGEDVNEDGRVSEDDDLQARVDVANQAGAALCFSIHHNGAESSAVRGTATFYCQHHPRGAEAQELAQRLQVQFLEALDQLGYAPRDLGARDDAGLNKPYGHLFLAGPKTPRVARPSGMPTVVGEPLFVTNPTEGALLQQDDTRQALAEAYCRAALLFLQARGNGVLSPEC